MRSTKSTRDWGPEFNLGASTGKLDAFLLVCFQGTGPLEARWSDTGRGTFDRALETVRSIIVVVNKTTLAVG